MSKKVIEQIKVVKYFGKGEKEPTVVYNPSESELTTVAKAICPEYQKVIDEVEFLRAEHPVNIAIRNENKTLSKSQQPETSVEQISKALVDSLGDPIEGNDYTIHTINGERWITHKEIGSGEPLKQWIESELKKIVKAVDPTFWRRLEMFVSNIQVNDMAGEEEKQYIIHVIESEK